MNTNQRSAVSVQPCGTCSRPGRRRVGRIFPYVPGYRRGFTLIEMAVVFAVIVVLAAVVGYGAKGWRNSAKVKLTHSIMGTLQLAMDEYKATHGDPPHPPRYVYYIDSKTGAKFYKNCPPVYYGQPADYYRNDDDKAHTPADAPIADPPAGVGQPVPVDHIWGSIETKLPFSSHGKMKLYGIQGLHFFLMDEPNAKKVLAKMSPSAFASADKVADWTSTSPLASQGSMPRDALAIVDAWGKPLYYGFAKEVNNAQPFLQSAGPDGVFGDAGADELWGTADDQPGDDIFSFKAD